jgi:sterol desaturase/sphingolipid hydroxylase (fatty acid hydroxylase superfamily)
MELLQRAQTTFAAMLRHALLHIRDFAIWEFSLYVIASLAAFAAITYFADRGLRRYFLRAHQPLGGQRPREVRDSLLSIATYSTVQLAARVIAFGLGYIVAVDRHMPLWATLLTFPFIVVVHDTYFYWTHRLMHLPALYRFFHWEHHKSREPTVFAAYSFSIPEAMIHGSFVMFYIFLLPGTIATIIFFYVFEVAWAVYVHSGVDFVPKSWVIGRFGWLCSSTYHDLHHRTARGNYSLYLRLWDRIMKTQNPAFERIFEYVRSPENDGHAYRLLNRERPAPEPARTLEIA